MIEYNGFEEIDNWIESDQNGSETMHTEAFESNALPHDLKIALENYSEQINQDIQEMSEDEAEEYLEFAWGPLIAGIVSAVPSVIGAIKNLTKRRRPARQPAAPPRRRNTSNGQRRTTRIPRPGSSSIPASPMQNNRILAQLSSLLQNPGVINAITSLANNGINRTLNSNSTVNATLPTARDAIEALGYLASEGLHEIPESHETIPEYLYAENGELLSDPYSPAERAALVVELLEAQSPSTKIFPNE